MNKYSILLKASECYLETQDVRIPVSLMIITLSTRHRRQGPVVLVFMSIGLWMVCRGKHISILEQLKYILKEYGSKVFSIV